MEIFFTMIKLEISYDLKKYRADVFLDKKSYRFKLIRKNNKYSWIESYSFQRFSCSINCRLRHYKEFKKRIFNNKYSYRMFVNL